MESWFIFALIALLIYGLWGFFPKLATNYINPRSVLIYQILGGMLVGIIVLFLMGFKLEVHTKGIMFAVLTGIAAITGTLFFLLALSKGKASVVVTMTALYPIIVILLAFVILKEPITWKQGFGMLLAIIAIMLFSKP